MQELLGPGQPAFRARQLYSALYRERVPDLAGASALPLALRRELAETIPVVPDIVGGHLGEDAVLVGAIATAMDTAWDLVFERRVRKSASEA